MGKNQCDACGHITSGFEEEEWILNGSAAVRIISQKDAEIAQLRADVERLRRILGE